jgi:dihydrofolate reductase
MGKVVCFLMASIDGYDEGTTPWSLDWHNVDAEFNEFAIQQLDDSEVLLFGRATYTGMAQYWPSADALRDDPEVATRMNGKPKIVFSRTLVAPDPEWTNTRLIRDVHELGMLKKESAKDLLVLGSTMLTTRLLELGLLEELRIIVAPVILGAGRSMFKTATQRFPLKLLSTHQFRSGNVLLTYGPADTRGSSGRS